MTIPPTRNVRDLFELDHIAEPLHRVLPSSRFVLDNLRAKRDWSAGCDARRAFSVCGPSSPGNTHPGCA